MEVLVGSVNLTTPGLSILRTRALLLYLGIFSHGGGHLALFRQAPTCKSMYYNSQTRSP